MTVCSTKQRSERQCSGVIIAFRFVLYVCQEFASTKTPVRFGCDVSVTDASGSLFAKNIYHAAMRNYRDAQSIQVDICTLQW